MRYDKATAEVPVYEFRDGVMRELADGEEYDLAVMIEIPTVVRMPKFMKMLSGFTK